MPSRSVMTCEPDLVVMGMSAVTFCGGMAGADAFQARLAAASGDKPVTVGSHAVAAALRAYGGVQRVAFMSPYFPAANTEVRRYLGGRRVRLSCATVVCECPSWTGIAAVPTSVVRGSFRELDGDDVDAILQVGTNLSAVRLAAAAELWLGKPVIAINTAIYWHALRAARHPRQDRRLRTAAGGVLTMEQSDLTARQMYEALRTGQDAEARSASASARRW